MEICKQGVSGRRGRLASMRTSMGEDRHTAVGAGGGGETVLRPLEYLDVRFLPSHRPTHTHFHQLA